MIDLSKSIEEISKQLISIESITGNEKEISECIEEYLKELEIDIYRLDNNLIVNLDNKSSKTVSLIGHLDTVPCSKEEQLNPEVLENKLYGRGAVDMKSGVACMLKLIYDIVKNKVKPKYNLKFIFYESEEGPLPNGLTKLLDEKKLENIDFAYVLEPTNSEYHVGCLGTITCEVVLKGKSAHSASAWLGDNAILKSSKIIKEIDNFEDKKGSINGREYVETMNITQICTSNRHNVIPDECKLTINYRFSPEKSIEEAKEKIKQLVGEHEINIEDGSPSCHVDELDTEFLNSDINKEICQGWTDIAQLNNAGIKAVNFGPGDLSVAHSENEYIKLDELNSFYELLLKHITQ